MKRLKRRWRRIAVGLLIVAMTAVTLSLYLSKEGITVSKYHIRTSKLNSPLRIVQLSDLHSHVFGDENVRLIRKITEQEPDWILITGDLVSSKDEDWKPMTSLIKELSDIAPVYYSLGNQEYALMNSMDTDLEEEFQGAGATILERDWIDLEIHGDSVRLGGIYGYCVPHAYAAETNSEGDAEYLEEFQNTENLCILMCHMPVSWVDGWSLYEYDVDVVFSGHAHGGQIRIPLIGGLKAPDQGWFPGSVSGVYTTNSDRWQEYLQQADRWSAMSGSYASYYKQDREYEEHSLVLSRGLGNTNKVPRLNNIPEVVVVDLLPEDSDAE